VKQQLYRGLWLSVTVGAGLWLALAVAFSAAQAAAPAPFSQSPLATPIPRRIQQVVPAPLPSVTVEPYQVSPLRIDDVERPLLGDPSALWIGAAGLLLLGGSAVLVVTRRR
jgi:hypothetical protein